MKNFTDSTFRPALKQLFATLRKQNIMARLNAGDCGSCASSFMGEQLEKNPTKLGAVYTTYQDDDNIEAGWTYVGFGARTHADADTAKIGNAIKFAAESLGLIVEWDNDPHTRIYLATKLAHEQQQVVNAASKKASELYEELDRRANAELITSRDRFHIGGNVSHKIWNIHDRWTYHEITVDEALAQIAAVVIPDSYDFAI